MSRSQIDEKHERQYESPAAGQKQLSERYGYWTAKVGDLSFQASLALIAANWAVFSSGLEDHGFAVASVLVALFSVVVSLSGAGYQAWLHFRVFDFAQKHKADWRRQWAESEHHTSAWPFNPSIIRLGVVMACTRLGLPVLSGALLLIAVFVKDSIPVETLVGRWNFYLRPSVAQPNQTSFWFSRELTPTCLPGAWYKAIPLDASDELAPESAYRFGSGKLEVLSYSRDCNNYIRFQGKVGERDFAGIYVRYRAGAFEEGSVKGLKSRNVTRPKGYEASKQVFWVLRP